MVVADKSPTGEDMAIADRLLAAYRAASAGAPGGAAPERADIWTDLRAGQSRFESLLNRGDPRELAAYLCNVSRQDAARGIAQGDIEFRRIQRDAGYRRFLTLIDLDKLVCLAEAVEARAVENPEQGVFGQALHADPSDLIRAIEERLGHDIVPPDVDGGLLKLRTEAGDFSERDLTALYSAHLLRQTLGGGTRERVCEIGGGVGRMAYWSSRRGVTDYTIVDLPQVNVVQGYYLLKTLASDRVRLYGEEGVDGPFDGLRILPAHAISEDMSHEYDLVLNQDSFPEMDPGTVREYLRWIRDCCRGSLLSVNQESKPPYGEGLAHVSVAEMVEEVGGFERRQRFPYWMRKGYVMELYGVLD